MSLERYLTENHAIPLHEAASFFIRVKTGAALDPRITDTLSARMRKHADEMGLQPTEAEEGNVQPVNGGLSEQVAALQSSEQSAQAAQEVNEAAFYREKARAAQEAAQAMQEQIGQLGQSVQTMQQQLEANQSQIQASVQHAQIAQQAALQNVMQSQEATSQAIAQSLQDKQEVLRQKQLAAAMRMGALQMKDSVMGALAADPTEQLAGQLTSPPPGSGGPVGGAPAQALGQGGDQQGPAAAAPDAPAAGGAVASEGVAEDKPKADDAKSDKADSKSEKGTKVEISTKEGSVMEEAGRRLPYALAGAVGGGAAGHFFATGSNDSLRGKIQSLEAEEASGQGGFGTALNLAQAKARLALSEGAAKFPGATAGVGAVLGALSAGSAGPRIVDNVRKGQKAHSEAAAFEQALAKLK